MRSFFFVVVVSFASTAEERRLDEITPINGGPRVAHTDKRDGNIRYGLTEQMKDKLRRSIHSSIEQKYLQKYSPEQGPSSMLESAPFACE